MSKHAAALAAIAGQLATIAGDLLNSDAEQTGAAVIAGTGASPAPAAGKPQLQGTAAPKAATGKPGRPPKATTPQPAPAPEPEPEAEETEQVPYSDVADRVKQLANEQGRDAVLAVLKPFGVDHAKNLTADQYADVVAALDAAISGGNEDLA